MSKQLCHELHQSVCLELGDLNTSLCLIINASFSLTSVDQRLMVKTGCFQRFCVDTHLLEGSWVVSAAHVCEPEVKGH